MLSPFIGSGSNIWEESISQDQQQLILSSRNIQSCYNTFPLRYAFSSRLAVLTILLSKQNTTFPPAGLLLLNFQFGQLGYKCVGYYGSTSLSQPLLAHTYVDNIIQDQMLYNRQQEPRSRYDDLEIDQQQSETRIVQSINVGRTILE